MDAQWITWGLQALVVFVLLWFRSQLEKNTDAITNLRVHLPETYATKDELKDFRRETEGSIHEIRDKFAARRT